MRPSFFSQSRSIRPPMTMIIPKSSTTTVTSPMKARIKIPVGTWLRGMDGTSQAQLVRVSRRRGHRRGVRWGVCIVMCV